MYRVFPLSQLKTNHEIVTKPFYYFLKIYDSKTKGNTWFQDMHMDRYMYLLNGVHKVNLFCVKTKQSHSFILTPTQVYKNEELYINQPSMFMIPSGIYYNECVSHDGCIATNIMKPNHEKKYNNNHFAYVPMEKTHDLVEKMI